MEMSCKRQREAAAHADKIPRGLSSLSLSPSSSSFSLYVRSTFSASTFRGGGGGGSHGNPATGARARSITRPTIKSNKETTHRRRPWAVLSRAVFSLAPVAPWLLSLFTRDMLLDRRCVGSTRLSLSRTSTLDSVVRTRHGDN